MRLASQTALRADISARDVETVLLPTTPLRALRFATRRLIEWHHPPLPFLPLAVAFAA